MARASCQYTLQNIRCMTTSSGGTAPTNTQIGQSRRRPSSQHLLLSLQLLRPSCQATYKYHDGNGVQDYDFKQPHALWMSKAHTLLRTTETTIKPSLTSNFHLSRDPALQRFKGCCSSPSSCWLYMDMANFQIPFRSTPASSTPVLSGLQQGDTSASTSLAGRSQKMSPPSS